MAGPHILFVNSPGFAPYRLIDNVPSTYSITLPPIHLSPATYFRIRVLAPDEEVILAPRLFRELVSSTGKPMSDPPGLEAARTDADGVTTMGPLPFGKSLLRVDVRHGATLHADVFDASGKPLRYHDVALDDVAKPSPIRAQTAKADGHGRATFGRLSAGRYRLSAVLPERCRGQIMIASRVVSGPGEGTAVTRLIVGGELTIAVKRQD